MERPQLIGRAKTSLVSGNGKAVISEIVAHRMKQQAGGRRLNFCGAVKFSDSVAKHIKDTILPVIDRITGQLKLSKRNFEISALNLGVASVLDVGVDVSGFSADVSFFIAMLSEALQISMNNDFVSTGHIASVEGDISAVEGIPAKIEAAISDGTIKLFIYPDLENDKSLKILSPNQRNRSIDAIMAVRESIRTKAVNGIGELARLVFDEENVVLASLREGFFGISKVQNQSQNPLHDVVSFLTDNNEKRFWDILQRYFINKKSEKARELLDAFAQFHISKEFYPADFGARLLQLIRSLPPAIRPKKIFPLFDKGLCKELNDFAKKNDYDDTPLLIDAVYGRNITSKVDTCLINTQQEIKSPDSDCIVFDAVVSQIKERAIAQEVGIPIDSARGSYILGASTVETFEEFIDVIEAYYIHMQRYISSSPDKAADMTKARTEVIALLQRTFRDKEGDMGAFTRARDGIKGGVRTILDALTEQYKAEKKEAYIELVFNNAIEALGWDERVRCIRGLIKRAGSSLAEELKDKPPERFARNYKTILRVFVRSFDNVEEFIRTM